MKPNIYSQANYKAKLGRKPKSVSLTDERKGKENVVQMCLDGSVG